jgi:tetratricopeptide (TPR) repeat protein
MPGDLHFISYSRKDGQAAAAQIFEVLTQAGFKPWMDSQDIHVGPHRWDVQIERAIKDSIALLYVITPNSVREESQCRNEYDYALKFKKNIVPLIFDEAVILPFGLLRQQSINFTNNFKRASEKLCKELEWLKSPEGQLNSLKYRLEKARLALRDGIEKGKDGISLGRITEEIKELEEDIAVLETVVANPDAARSQNEKRIKQSLELERQTVQEVPTPKTRIINSPPGQVPAYYQDRVRELGLAGYFLRSETQRVLQVVGRAGIGKTIMICRLLRALEEGRMPDDQQTLEVDGIVYLSNATSRQINLANLYNDLCLLLPPGKAQGLAEIYRDQDNSVSTKIRCLLTHFPADLQVVVLLDDFESLIDEESGELKDHELDQAFQTLIKAPAHGLKLILTTRIAPRQFLMLPQSQAMTIELDEGLPYEFAKLVLQQLDEDGKLGLRNASEELLREACERTLGYPKALEALAAALRVDRSSSLEEILAVTAAQSLPENVIQVLVGEAFDRLDAQAQQIIQALAIYGEPVKANAIDYLLNPYLPGLDSTRLLKRLVNNYFVRKEQDSYYLHPVDRDYAVRALPLGEKGDAFKKLLPFSRFALWERGAEFFKAARLPKKQWHSLSDLRPLIKEVKLRCAAQDYDQAAKLLRMISEDYLLEWGEYQLLIELHTPLQGRIKDLELAEVSLADLAKAFLHQARTKEALQCYQQAETIAIQRKDKWNRAKWFTDQAVCFMQSGEFGVAYEKLQEALKMARETNNLNNEGVCLTHLGLCYMERGEPELAVQHLKVALELSRLTPDWVMDQRNSKGYRATYLSMALNDQGQYDQALPYAREGVELGRELNSHAISSKAYYALACTQLYLNRLEEALESAKAGESFEEPFSKPNLLVLQGIIQLRRGFAQEAGEAFKATLLQLDKYLASNSWLYEALYVKSLALCGLLLLQAEAKSEQLLEAMAAYDEAYKANHAPGLVQRFRQLFQLLVETDTLRRLHLFELTLNRENR